MFQLTVRSALIPVVIAGIFCGCGGGGSNEKLQKVYPVTGVVKYQGQPVEGATVTFTLGGEKSRTAFGKSGPNGEFKITTYKKDDGAVAGKHAVTVTKVETSEPDANGIVPPDKQLLPERYADLGTTPLTADVTDKGPNTVELILE